MTLDHSEHLLPPEVLLFEPSDSEIFLTPGAKSLGSRLIFLNTPLLKEEQEALEAFHVLIAKSRAEKSDEALQDAADDDELDEFPCYVRLQALRMLQLRKYNAWKAVQLIHTHLKERVRRLPLTEAEMLPDLRRGFMYWHGRDNKARPCLVLNLARAGALFANKEQACKIAIYVLEYAIRFVMVPGRVENWVVLIDLLDATSMVSITKIPSLASTAANLATILDSVYTGRMRWIKILNMPPMLSAVVSRLIPAEKVNKIAVIRDVKAEVLPFFQANQLEEKYGGSAPNVKAEETYPFQFFPNCTGAAAGAEDNSKQPTSLHTMTDRPFHEGMLLDKCRQAKWMTTAATKTPLTARSAKYLQGLSAGEVPSAVQPQACEDLTLWAKVMRVARGEPSESDEERENEKRRGTPGGDAPAPARDVESIEVAPIGSVATKTEQGIAESVVPVGTKMEVQRIGGKEVLNEDGVRAPSWFLCCTA